MEQTNLVVTPDGKTWDEVTRDTSYIGNVVLSVRDSEGWNTNTDWDTQRGVAGSTGMHCFIKDSWVVGFDRWICLKPGEYTVKLQLLSKDNLHYYLKLNGSNISGMHSSNLTTGIHDTVSSDFNMYFKRGDYLETNGQRYSSNVWSYFQILKSEGGK